MSYVSEVEADAPKAWYRMQEASGLIQDETAYANHATSSVGTASYQIASPITSEPSDYSIAFIEDSFSIPDDPDIDFGDTLTVEAWISKDDSIERAICARGSNALTFTVNTGGYLVAYKADVGEIVTATASIVLSSWYHVAYTKATTTSKLYLNGADVTGTVTDRTLSTTATPLIVGADYNGTSIQWNGGLDEVAFYSTALSADRILAHYNAALGITGGPPTLRIVRGGLRW